MPCGAKPVSRRCRGTASAAPPSVVPESPAGELATDPAAMVTMWHHIPRRQHSPRGGRDARDLFRRPPRSRAMPCVTSRGVLTLRILSTSTDFRGVSVHPSSATESRLFGAPLVLQAWRFRPATGGHAFRRRLVPSTSTWIGWKSGGAARAPLHCPRLPRRNRPSDQARDRRVAMQAAARYSCSATHRTSMCGMVAGPIDRVRRRLQDLRAMPSVRRRTQVLALAARALEPAREGFGLMRAPEASSATTCAPRGAPRRRAVLPRHRARVARPCRGSVRDSTSSRGSMRRLFGIRQSPPRPNPEVVRQRDEARFMRLSQRFSAGPPDTHAAAMLKRLRRCSSCGRRHRRRAAVADFPSRSSA